MPVNQGATWNRTLVRLIGRAIAIEARAIGVDTVFAPVVNLWTDPRFGRLQEGYSENPFLTATLGMEAVLGLQHNVTTPSDYLDNVSVASLGKHYAAYGAATGGLNGGPASVDRRMLFEVYLRPWSALASVGMRACMPAHNTVLGVPCHANEYLLKDVLRERFGFRGVALSDCNDIGVLVDYRYAANASHAASLALKAGVDWDLQCGTDPEQWGCVLVLLVLLLLLLLFFCSPPFSLRSPPPPLPSCSFFFGPPFFPSSRSPTGTTSICAARSTTDWSMSSPISIRSCDAC